jgi:hypothetical protein
VFTVLKRVLFTLLHNLFRFLAINGHEKNKRSAEIYFYLTGKKVCEMRRTRRSLGSPMLRCRFSVSSKLHRWVLGAAENVQLSSYSEEHCAPFVVVVPVIWHGRKDSHHHHHHHHHHHWQNIIFLNIVFLRRSCQICQFLGI